MEQNDGFLSEISRRNFVKGAGILAVGVGAAGLSPLQALAAPMAPKRVALFE